MAQIFARPTTKGEDMWFCQHCTFKCNTTESALAHEEQSDFKHYTLWVADGYEQLSSK